MILIDYAKMTNIRQEIHAYSMVVLIVNACLQQTKERADKQEIGQVV
jgi:hypothetical protein